MEEGTGWGGEFWLHNGSTLVELLRTTEIDFPDVQDDEEEVTTLKSEGRFKEFITTLKDGGSFTVTMNYIPGSATDVLCRAARASRPARAWKIVVPDEDGGPAWQFTGSAFARGYKPDPLSPASAKKIVLTMRVTGAVIDAAAS